VAGERGKILDSVYNTRDMQISVIRGLSYGRTGVGKTHFGGTFPRPLFLSAQTEGGIVTLRNKGVDAIDIYDSTDMLNALEELHALAQVGKLRDRWDSVIIDSITLYCEQYINELVEKAPGNRKMMRRVDWGQLDSHLRTITVMAHELPMNVWWMALEDHEKDGETGNVVNAFPMLYGKRSAKILASMDIVLWHEMVKTGKNQKDIYRCHAKPYLYYDAKDRFAVLPSPMDDPSFDKISRAIGLQP
jgi:hypothetical protein